MRIARLSGKGNVKLALQYQGQCQVRMDRSDWKGNIKLKGLGQMRLAGSGGKCDGGRDGRSDRVMVIADPRDASASKKAVSPSVKTCKMNNDSV